MEFEAHNLCVCVCVWEREREREKGEGRERYPYLIARGNLFKCLFTARRNEIRHFLYVHIYTYACMRECVCVWVLWIIFIRFILWYFKYLLQIIKSEGT